MRARTVLTPGRARAMNEAQFCLNLHPHHVALCRLGSEVGCILVMLSHMCGASPVCITHS